MTSSTSSSLKQSLGELLGIARGLMADEELTNSEIRFLDEWLEERYVITSSFPGNVIHGRVKEVLEDGLGVDEWRTGGLGTEIERAIKLRATGKEVKIIPEDSWVALL